MSYSTKALTLFGVLPLVLKRFSPEDVVIWYLYSTIIALQSIADFGFRSTFTRIISFANSGAQEILDYSKNTPALSNEGEKKTEPNVALLNSIYTAMNWIYKRLTVVVFLILVAAGTWAMKIPISHSTSTKEAWTSWIIVLIVSTTTFYAKIYLNFLEGINKIALVRRVETLTSLGAILTSITVLIVIPNLLALVIANQAWLIIVSFRDWYLCKKTENNLFASVSAKTTLDKKLLKVIWKPAWRSGISGLMSTGLTNVTGIVYAQLGNSVAVASYLLAIRLINQVRDISMAPFYSKIPLYSQLRVQENISLLKKQVQRSMFLSHSVYVVGLITIGIFATPILKYVHSDVPFVSQKMWLLLGFAFFVHRFGAMHIQAYITTNHIISHIADGISGGIYIISALILVKSIGLYAIPVAMLLGYLGFYSWYAATFSYKSLNTSVWEFEKKGSLIPLGILGAYAIIILCYHPN